MSRGQKTIQYSLSPDNLIPNNHVQMSACVANAFIILLVQCRCVANALIILLVVTYTWPMQGQNCETTCEPLVDATKPALGCRQEPFIQLPASPISRCLSRRMHVTWKPEIVSSSPQLLRVPFLSVWNLEEDNAWPYICHRRPAVHMSRPRPHCLPALIVFSPSHRLF